MEVVQARKVDDRGEGPFSHNPAGTLPHSQYFTLQPMGLNGVARPSLHSVFACIVPFRRALGLAASFVCPPGRRFGRRRTFSGFMMTSKVTGLAKRFERLAGWRRAAVGGALVLAVAGGTWVTHVQAQGRMEGGPGGGPGGMMFGGPPEHMARHLDGLLDGLGVTDAQRSQIRRIAMAAAADFQAQREAGRGLRERGLQLFTGPRVDASAAEVVRQQMLAQQDQSSKRMLQAMLDIAQVLTPEQRAKIGARMNDRQAVMQDRMQRMLSDRQHGHVAGRERGDTPVKP